jgi:hypothetical protein
MSERVKLRATLTWTYEADSDDYGTDDPDKMAAIDQEQGGIVMMEAMRLDHPPRMEYGVVEFRVEPVKKVEDG